MTKDEEIRINATLGEMANATMRANARAADLAAECASVRAQLEEEKAKNAVPPEGKPVLTEVK
jgi:hypothetical protein